jgi:hydroxyacylglutathione hydrolase
LVGFVVDPSEPGKVLPKLKEIGVEIMLILTTHHHADHAAGNGAIKEKYPHSTVVGGDERIDPLDRLVKNNETLEV